MADHAWCRSPARDEAVRASEDGRQGPLPTLEECIERVTERRPVPPRGGGNVTDFAKPAKCSPAVSETGETQSRLRTERVTLEVTHDYLPHASALDWPYMVANYFHRNGESVRVVEDGDSWRAACESARIASGTIADITAERDAAIRERDAHKEEYYTLRAERITQALTADRFAAAVQEADKLRARVAELESAAKLAPAANAAGGSNHAAPAASGAAGSYWMVRWPDGGDHDIDDELFADEQTARHMAELEDGAVVVELVERHSASGAAGTEVVAWGIANPGNPIFGNQKVWAVRATEEIAKDVYRSCNGWVHFPLYAAPQPAKGWLTAEERKWVEYMSGNCVLPYAGMKCMEAILARSSPPEVVLPPMVIAYDDMDMLKESLAAAGVTVKEVGK